MNKLVLKSIGNTINFGTRLFPKWSADYAFRLLCRVQRVGISEKGRNFLNKGTPTHLNAKGHSAVIHTWGTGKKQLVFLHGWMSNSQRWLPYANRLDHKEFTIHAIDFPGHGMATGNSLNLEMCRDALAQTLERVGEVDTLVGHSLGSLVAAYTYLHDPTIAVNKYVIMGSPSGLDAIFTYFQNMLGLSERSVHHLGKKINSILQLPHSEVTMKRFFQKVTQPLLVVHERSDTVTPYGPIEKAMTEQPNINQYITDDQDHNLKGKHVVDKVIQFITQ